MLWKTVHHPVLHRTTISDIFRPADYIIITGEKAPNAFIPFPFVILAFTYWLSSEYYLRERIRHGTHN